MHLADNTKICYTYDNLSRVTNRTIKNECDCVISSENFTYDAAGNITDAPNSCFMYDANNRLITFNGNTVSYDMDGNMLSNGYINCEFDSGNRLLKAGINEYVYNAEDVRIKNLCQGDVTTYTYNTNCKLSQLLQKTTNGITTKYVYGLGLIGEEKCGEFKTYHFDYRGSTVAITDECGNITDTFKYDTYGKLISRTGNSFVILGYNGRDGVVTDRNGLLYMRARYYSPDMRRFINADILHGEISDSTSLNRYSYVNGNPVSFVDPFGLSAERGNSEFTVVWRSDINGIGLTKNGEIFAGNNVKESDIELLIKIATMTANGVSNKEILSIVNAYVKKMKKDTVIKENKLLDYYTSFDDITKDLFAYMLREEYMNTMCYTNDGKIHSIGESELLWMGYLEEFYNSVKNGAKWDLKQKSKWQQSSLYYFDGELVDSDAPGNIMYGYMGKAYGIPDSVLHAGAGYAQISAGTSSWKWFATLGDDPMDSNNIDRGISFYNKLH